jgi:hypothetical protein
MSGKISGVSGSIFCKYGINNYLWRVKTMTQPADIEMQQAPLILSAG